MLKYLLATGFILVLLQQFIAHTAVAKTLKLPEINIFISNAQFADLKKENGTKVNLKEPTMLINGDTTFVKEIHARGNNSLKFQRKSLSVDLEKTITIELGDEKINLKKFNLISLSMDKYMWHNRFANLVLKQMGLFPLHNTYCTVTINGVKQGIYLLIEKPQHYQNAINSPYMLRRGIDHKIADEHFHDGDIATAHKFRKQYQAIYTSINKKQPADFEKLLHLSSYYQWMAFNYLLMNGDYSDEVYFIVNPKTNLFEIIPWDFDDLLRFAPHEGTTTRKLSHADKKIFSLEDKLDMTIANNSELYAAYEKELKNSLLLLDSVFFTEKCNQILAELKAASIDPETARASLFLDQQPFDYNSARGDILMSLDLILKRRNWILQELK